MSPPEFRTIGYGPRADQSADLYLPDSAQAPVVCLLHGGFWRMPYGRDQWQAAAADLVHRGYAVWNLGYRRLGAPGGGWPGIFDDVRAGIAHLARLGGDRVDLARVAVAGHSAGGHLALWAAAQQLGIAAAVGLAPVSDLAQAHVLGLGNGATAELLGGSPAERPERYAAASPRELLPLGVPQLLLHGTDDAAVPIDMSRGYARAARAAGDPVTLIELAGTGHMEFLDPTSEAHAALCDWLNPTLGVAA